jgi:hypothetical protein
MKRSSNPCPAWRESVCLLAGNSLPAGEQTEVQHHLAECAGCRAYLEEMKSLTAPLANWEKNVSGVQPDQMLRARWRKAVLTAKTREPVRQFSFRLALRTAWHELIRPCRHAWAGLAALWLMMAGINAAMSGGQRNVQSAHSSAPTMAFQVFEEQRQVLAELIPPILGEPIEPPRRSHPQPRSERKIRWSMG